jgi:hypothetical protein
MKKAAIFISYRRADTGEEAEAIEEALRRQHTSTGRALGDVVDSSD